MGLRGGYWEQRWLADRYRYGDFRPPIGYFAAVRHPLPSLIFVVVLLAIYEMGVAYFASAGGPSVRAGIELWLRNWLAQAGPAPPIVIPAAVVGLLVIWTLWKYADRPHWPAVTVLGIAIEGVVFGLGLWFVCLHAPALLEQSGLSLAAIQGLDSRLITFDGVGVYEEVLFRLIFFAWLARLLYIVFVPWIAAFPMAVIVSAALFALAHDLLQNDPFVPMVFAMRTLIGIYLALVFALRGLGVAIAAHIVYDFMVSLPHE